MSILYLYLLYSYTSTRKQRLSHYVVHQCTIIGSNSISFVSYVLHSATVAGRPFHDALKASQCCQPIRGETISCHDYSGKSCKPIALPTPTPPPNIHSLKQAEHQRFVQQNRLRGQSFILETAKLLKKHESLDSQHLQHINKSVYGHRTFKKNMVSCYVQRINE